MPRRSVIIHRAGSYDADELHDRIAEAAASLTHDLPPGSTAWRGFRLQLDLLTTAADIHEAQRQHQVARTDWPATRHTTHQQLHAMHLNAEASA